MTVVQARRLEVVRPAVIVAGLGMVVAVRWAATVSGAGDGIAIGLVFGVSLAIVALSSGRLIWAANPSSIALGLAVGGALVGLAMVSRGPIAVPVAAPSAFGAWALVTILVAVTEEAVLRGALFDAIEDVGGAAVSVVATSLVFGLIHVPLYGWHVLPLDIGVGLALAGLRLITGGIAAPAAAHAIADLATWWL